MRKLFLHIGTHKTGTTSFQVWLMHNRERLRDAGIAVCSEKHEGFGHVANCFSLPSAVLRRDLMTVARMTGDAKKGSLWDFAGALLRVAKFLSDREANRFILSAEGFCFARQPSELARIRRLFGAADLEVIPVACFRNENAWRESWSQEIARWQGNFRRPHGEGTGDVRGDWYFDREAICKFWRQVGPLRTVDFDSAVDRDGTVIPALLDAVELDHAGNTGDYFLNTRENSAFSAPAPAAQPG